MLERFLRYFGEKDTFHYNGDLYRDFLTQFGGRSFGNGLFRVFRPEDVPEWTQIVFEAFPWVTVDFKLIGYDWSGCVFAVYDRKDGKQIILSFDLGLDEVGVLEMEMEGFLNSAIPRNANGSLNESHYRKWLRKTKQPVKYTDAVSVKTPVDYGGKFDVDNMEICDMEVYWAVFTAFRNSREGEERRRRGPT